MGKAASENPRPPRGLTGIADLTALQVFLQDQRWALTFRWESFRGGFAGLLTSGIFVRNTQL